MTLVVRNGKEKRPLPQGKKERGGGERGADDRV